MSTKIGVKITGIGVAVPSNVVTNADLESTIDTSDHWIRSRTGIRCRRWATSSVSTGDLAVAAGKSALQHAGLAHVDRVILATTTPNHPCPATAPWVANQLGMGHIAAFDVSAVCSGFLYALALGSETIRSGSASSTLVIAAETFSRLLNTDDRTTSVIFGDGAGAVILQQSDGVSDHIGSIVLASDGADYDAIIVPAGGSRHKLATKVADRYFAMDGRRVFQTAVLRMAAAIRDVLAQDRLSIQDCDWLVAHQANKRILTAVAHQLSFPTERVIVDLDRYGNTSCASIPLAIAHYSTNFKPGERILLTAFGGGTTWGATTIVWPNFNNTIQPDIELGAHNG